MTHPNRVNPAFPEGPIPDGETLYQRQEDLGPPAPIQPIPVNVSNPVSTWELPAKRIEFENILITQGARARLVIDPNPALKRILLSCPQVGGTTPFNVWIGKEADLNNPSGPYGFPLLINGAPISLEGFNQPVYAILTGPAATQAYLAKASMYWAD